VDASTLSLAVGVAASPLPVIAAIAFLLGLRARATAVALLAGWAASIAAVVSVVEVIADGLPSAALTGPRPVQGAIQLALATLAVVLAIASWTRRPRPGDSPRLPAWLNAVDGMRLPVAFAVGAVLVPLSPKNLLLTASAGVQLGAAPLTTGETVAAIAVFTLVAASTVLLPVAAYLVWTTRLDRVLEVVRSWLIRHNAVITTTLLAVLAVWLTVNAVALF
jgi:hypothetical protein